MAVPDENVKKVIRYDKDTGKFYWLVDRGSCYKEGQEAGRVQKSGFVGVSVDGKHYRGHSLAWWFVTGKYVNGKSIKHKDGDKSNNSFENLYIPRLDDISQDYIKDILDYDSTTGVFTWKKPRCNRIKKGDVAGCKSSTSGYISIYIFNKPYLAHRLAWLYVHGRFPKDQIDHKDRDRANNSIDNLREVDNAGNAYNSLSSRNKTGCPGVGFHKITGKFYSSITINRKKMYLGLFENIEDAIATRKQAEVDYGISDLCYKKEGT